MWHKNVAPITDEGVSASVEEPEHCSHSRVPESLRPLPCFLIEKKEEVVLKLEEESTLLVRWSALHEPKKVVLNDEVISMLLDMTTEAMSRSLDLRKG